MISKHEHWVAAGAATSFGVIEEKEALSNRRVSTVYHLPLLSLANHQVSIPEPNVLANKRFATMEHKCSCSTALHGCDYGSYTATYRQRPQEVL
jgi:hypothetical protein